MKNKIKKIVHKLNSNSFWKNLFKNSFYAILGEGGASVINLFVVVLLIRMIGSEGYGILTLAQSYMFIIDGIINMQCWRGVIKFGEEAEVANDLESKMGYIKLGTILDISTAILGAILSFFCTNLIGHIFNWSSVLIQATQIFSLVIVFHFSGTPTAILRMEDKFNLVAIQKVISSILKVLAIGIILLFYGKISVLLGVIIYVITDIIGHLILIGMALFVVHKKMGIMSVIKSKFPKKTKEFIKFTVWTTLSDVVDIPVAYLDVFIVSSISLSMVSVLKVFKQIISIVSKLTTPVYQAIYPQFSKLVAQSQSKQAYGIVLKIRNVILKFFVPVSMLVGLTSYWWLKFIFGIDYALYWYVLCVYLIAHTVALSYTTIHPYFASIGKVLQSFIICAIANIVYLAFAYCFTKWIGILGLVFAYVIQFTIVICSEKVIIEKYLKKEAKS